MDDCAHFFFSFFAILKPKWAENSYLRPYMQCTLVGKISAHGVESRLGIEDFIESTLRTLVSKLDLQMWLSKVKIFFVLFGVWYI